MSTREIAVRELPVGYGVWRGDRYKEDSFRAAVKRGEVKPLRRRVNVDTGRVAILYRRLKAPAPWWVGPAKVAAVVVPALAFTGVVLYVALRTLWQVLPLLAGVAAVALLVLFLLTRGGGGGHGGHGFHWSKC